MTEPAFEFTDDDRNNLQFIIAKQLEGDSAMDEWLSSISEDDLEYTLDLLRHFTTQRSSFVNNALTKL